MNDLGDQARTNANPRSVGAVLSFPPYWHRPLTPDYKGRGVRLMVCLVKKNTSVGYDNPDGDQYKGKVVQRGFVPPY